MSTLHSSWYQLRGSRANPPGAAGLDPVLAAEYRAALQQAEELWRAAGSVGYASRPLPLYYALTQAGRAIVAARGSDDRLAASAHGLGLPTVAEVILETVIEPGHKGQFPLVAAATRSCALKSGVQLGALMATLPELARKPELESRWLRALPAWPLPLPPNTYQVHATAVVPAVVVFPEMPNTQAQIKSTLAHYPMEVEPTIRLDGGVEVHGSVDGAGAVVHWLRPYGSREPLPAAYRPDEDRRWLRPAVCEGEPPPSILMTWWAVLYGLSMLARYHPVEWEWALAVNSSPVAVLLEQAMDVALIVVPELVLEAIETPGD